MMHTLMDFLRQGLAATTGGADGDDKTASLDEARLAQRQEALEAILSKEAGDHHAAFALVVWDGRDHYPKYPILTADDVRLSHDALEKAAERLPEEVLRVARFHLDLAAREHLGAPLYAETQPTSTNIVFTGQIDAGAYAVKVASSQNRSRENTLFRDGRFPIVSAEQVKEADRLFETGAIFSLAGKPSEVAQAGLRLAGRAEALGLSLSKEAARFNRNGVSVSFGMHVALRKEAAPEVLAPYYDELLEKAARAYPGDGLPLPDLVEAIELLDRHAGFVVDRGAGRLARPLSMSKLGRSALSPIDLVFPLGEEAVEKTAGLDTAQSEKIALYFGEDFLSAWKADKTAALQQLSAEERRLLASF